MNLIGNAVKFTAHGYIRVDCSVEDSPMSSLSEVNLKFEIRSVPSPISNIFFAECFYAGTLELVYLQVMSNFFLSRSSKQM
jgi:signal transduction histidine kinase